LLRTFSAAAEGESKRPGIKALDIAAEKAETKIYVYDITKFSLVNNKPFLRSSILRSSASKVLPISANTLSKKLDWLPTARRKC
jgi:hypothetical protein